MPQVDLETLVSACAGGGVCDRKVACETLSDGNIAVAGGKPENPPDFPPESFWLSKDAEFDWFDRNAFLDRKQSTKGIGQNTNPGTNSNSSSQRFSSSSTTTFKSKASIIGFPKTQKASYVDSKRRTCRPANIRLFPAKRSESTLKSAATVNEPSSPKVSCMGRVRSKRRSRSRRSSEKSKKCEKNSNSLERSRSNNGEKRKTGFCSRLLSIFRSSRSNKKPVRSSTDKAIGLRSTEEPIKTMMRKSKSVSIEKTRGAPVCVEPASLGGMNRFASGRRSESWGGDDINGVV